MLLRQDDLGVLAIGQPSHAWVSGQLGRAWGNARFGDVAPWEEVCLAAEQHDIGMAAWDLEPSLNPETGLPHSFIEMPLEVHMGLWRAGPRRLIRQSRYAALLCSMHGVRLYGLRDLAQMAAPDAQAVRAFMSEQRDFQSTLTATLDADPGTRADAAPERVARNSDLIWTWDFMSLALCLGWAPCTAKNVPVADGSVALQLLPGENPGQVQIDPWPFGVETVRVHCEGQRLDSRYANAAELTRALAAAPWETLSLELVRARSA